MNRRGKCDRRGRCMTERLLLMIQRRGGMLRKEIDLYLWRMQGQPGGTFKRVMKRWTVFGLKVSYHHRSQWNDNLIVLRNQGWIEVGEDGKYRVPAGVVVKLPIYSRKPSEPPPKRSPPYDPADHYVEQTELWKDIV